MARWNLTKVEIVGGFLSGLSLELPQGLVCIIGPRGSGKSTLAEALRYAMLGTKGPSDDRYSLIKSNLGQSVVTASAQRVSDGITFTIRRTFGNAASLTGGDGRAVADVDLDRGTFLPIDGFSADRIEKIAVESLGDLRRTLLDELRSEDLHRIQMRVSELRRQLDANADEIRGTERAIVDFTERIEELGDARSRLTSLPVPSEDHTSTALADSSKQAQINAQEARWIAQVRESLKSHKEKQSALTAEFMASLKRTVTVPNSRNKDVVDALSEVLAQSANKTEILSSSIIELVSGLESVVSQRADELEARHKSEELEYIELQEKNHVAGAAVKERAAALEAVTTLENLERQKADAQKRLADLREKRKSIKGDYLLEHGRISDVREEVASQLQREAGKKVRIRIARNADSLEYQQTLLGGLKGARVKNHDDILRAMMRLRPEQLAQIIQDNDFGEFEELTSLGAERGRKVLNSCRDNLDPLSLEIVAIEDKVSIELNVGTDADPNYKDAAELSSGQKCTALLPLLMARRDSPLVIDQPEDNVDNHFIFESVVETIRRLKPKRQMVFVTHNANIPVLGEAELVVVLDSDGKVGRVVKAGGLDDCRDEIIDLLEGGREAFERRRKRYGST